MIFRSIRWRLQIWHALILVVVLVGFGFTAYEFERSRQFRRIDEEMQQRMGALDRALRPPGPPERGRPEQRGMRPFGPDGRRGGPPPTEDGPPQDGSPQRPPRPVFQPTPQITNLFENTGEGSYYYILFLHDGTELGRSSAAPARVAVPTFQPDGPQPHHIRMLGTTREIFHFSPRGDCILVGHSIQRELSEMRRLAWWLTVAGAGVLVIGLAGGWWLATKAIRPIAEISSTALKIAGGDLSQRIPAEHMDDELGHLANVLNTTFSRLDAAFSQQGRFTADASHELRTPVSVIISQTQVALQRERQPAEYRQALEACQRAASRMRELIKSLLELARLDAGQEPMTFRLFDLGATARECVEMVSPLAAERSIRIECDLPQVECAGDPGRIAQVITNLLNNAIHFNNEGGTVHVATEQKDGDAALVVTDTGPGIPEEDVPHIFERFYRVDKSRSRGQGNSGLGLAICKAIMDAHGASITVTSTLGSGTKFRLQFPKHTLNLCANRQ